MKTNRILHFVLDGAIIIGSVGVMSLSNAEFFLIYPLFAAAILAIDLFKYDKIALPIVLASITLLIDAGWTYLALVVAKGSDVTALSEIEIRFAIYSFLLLLACIAKITLLIFCKVKKNNCKRLI